MICLLKWRGLPIGRLYPPGDACMEGIKKIGHVGLGYLNIVFL
jgi:hypothetical protein